MTQPLSTTEVITDLAAVAAELRTELGYCRGHLASAVQHALRVGELLRQANEQVPHGEWRQSQKYMKLAAGRVELDKDDPDWHKTLTINGALRRLGKLLDRAEESTAQSPVSAAGEEKEEVGTDKESPTVQSKLHEQRCRRLKRFLTGGKLTKSDLPVMEAVDTTLETFTREVVRLARKQGQSLCKKEELEGADGDFVAMVLFSKLDTDAARCFAPQMS
jgi:hypothetical protein